MAPTSTSVISASELSAGLKVFYKSGQAMGKVVYDGRARPFLAMVKKNSEYGGNHMPIPIMYEDAAGGSCTFSTAQLNVEEPALAQFQMDTVEYHRVLQISVEALRRMRSDKTAFLKQVFFKSQTLLNALANDIEKSLFRSEVANYGKISAIDTSNNYITLTNASDAKLFQVGDRIVSCDGIADGDNPATPDTAITDTIAVDTASKNKITKIDRTNGYLYTSDVDNWATHDPAVGDYIWREGDVALDSWHKHLAGLRDHMPASLSADDLGNTVTTTWNSVDRSADRNKLAGVYKSDGDANNIYTSMKDHLLNMHDQPGAFSPEVTFVDSTMWGNLADEVNMDVRRAPLDGRVGLRYIEVYTPGGVSKVYPAVFCGPNISWHLTISSWELISLGPVVALFNDDGMVVLRVHNSASLEIRAISFPQLVCHMPAANGRVDYS